MSQSSAAERHVSLSVRNVGGISETTVEFEPGVTILSGRNATNRTSLLRAIMAALGSDDASLKSDADEGEVRLDIGEETYTRRFVRQNGTVTTEGDPYLDDPELADLFAFLLATNETRQAVLTGKDLRELIMRPVDTAAINDEIESLEAEKYRLDEELAALSDLTQRLPDLEGERADLGDRIDELETELVEKRAEIEDAEASVDESREDERSLDEKMSELGDVRSELDTARQELRAQRESLASLRADREELEEAAEELPDEPAGEIAEIDAAIDDRREEQQAIQSELNTLQRVIQFNEDNVEGASSDVMEALTGHSNESDSESLTRQLVDDSEAVVCWTCGHEEARADIEETLERLRDLRQSKLSESRTIDDRIDELEDERITYEEKQRQREQVIEQLRRTREQIESREDRIAELEERRDDLEDEIEAIEASVEELQTQKDDAVLSLHKEANQLEVDLNRLEKEREVVVEEIEGIESELERREDMEARREAVREELADLRTRIEQIEEKAVDSFNEHMDVVLEALEYDNLARIWIERTETDDAVGRGSGAGSAFALHIVRESESGAAYEDRLEHLSESEREVTALVFALAGYLVHDVYETVPFMLLDSVEAIDSDRIARLVEHFEAYPDYLVAALLPEDAAATKDAYPIVSEI